VFVRLPATVMVGGQASSARLVNLADGGAGLELGTRVASGTVLEFQFRLPRVLEPVTLTARVMWVAPALNKTWEVGVRFETDSAGQIGRAHV
jgi:hypothetical protein